MPRTRSPRKGTMQFWPRKRARRSHTRIRSWPESKDVKMLGFAGYKVGMTSLTIIDNKPTSMTKGAEIVVPATVIECPPFNVGGINFYKQDPYGLHLSSSFMASQPDKELVRVLPLPKKQTKSIDSFSLDNIFDVRLLVYTQPKDTNQGKKKPEFFEFGIGGSSVKDKFDYAKSVLGKEIKVTDVLSAGNQVDVHSVTKGKGVRGPVQRFGIAIRHHKAEKTKRGPGSLGPWHGRKMWNVAFAGKTGYNSRTEFNKLIISINNDASKIQPKGDFLRYGKVKNDYVLLKGSIPGSIHRLIKMTKAWRPNKNFPSQTPTITNISLASRQ